MGQWTRSTLLVAALAALAAVAAAQYGPTPVGKLEGVVLNAKGKPVADASVTIQASDGLHPHATHTDASGRFEFDRWATGQYDLRAYSNGIFSDWNKRILIRAGKTTTITLRLQDEK